MNTASICVNLICIGIVLTALLVSAVAFVLGKIKKNMKLFHKTMEAIDFILLMFVVFAVFLIIASIAALMLITNKELVDPSGFIIPMFLSLSVLCYLTIKECLYGTIKKLLTPSENIIRK